MEVNAEGIVNITGKADAGIRKYKRTVILEIYSTGTCFAGEREGEQA
jgi:hypothetical protein